MCNPVLPLPYRTAETPVAALCPLQVYIDTVGDAERYAEKLQRIFPDLAFTVCPKADALYPVVSAASIVAKVSRDHALEACQQVRAWMDGWIGRMDTVHFWIERIGACTSMAMPHAVMSMPKCMHVSCMPQPL